MSTECIPGFHLTQWLRRAEKQLLLDAQMPLYIPLYRKWWKSDRETQSLKTAIKETLIKGAMIGHNTSANSSGKELPLLPSDTTSRTFIITNLSFM